MSALNNDLVIEHIENNQDQERKTYHDLQGKTKIDEILEILRMMNERDIEREKRDIEIFLMIKETRSAVMQN
jgi:hypothetical protein